MPNCTVVVNTVAPCGTKNHKFLQVYNYRGAPVPTPLTNYSQVWHTRVDLQSALTRQISSDSVYSVTKEEWKLPNFTTWSFSRFGWRLNKKAARVNILLAFLHWGRVGITLHPWPFVLDIAVFVLRRYVKLQLTNHIFNFVMLWWRHLAA